MRYWSLIRMLYSPLRFPSSVSSRFPGSKAKSRSVVARFRWKSLRSRDFFYAMKLFRELLPKDLFRLGISKRANHNISYIGKRQNIKEKLPKVPKGLWATTVSSRHAATGIPAWAASVSATASHKTVFTSSPRFENLAIARWPSRSRTEAFGRAPPSDEPGARSKRKSSSLSVSLKTCSAAKRSRGSSISGGIFAGSNV